MQFGKSVWYANRISEENAEIPEFNLPVEVITRPNYLTVMSASLGGYLSLMQFGEKAENTWTIVVNAYLFGDKIKEGDVMWLDGDMPIPEIEAQYGNGASATANIVSATQANRNITIIAERNQKQVKK